MKNIPVVHYGTFHSLRLLCVPREHEIPSADLAKLSHLANLDLSSLGYPHPFDCANLGQLAHLQVLSVSHHSIIWDRMPPLMQVHTLKITTPRSTHVKLPSGLERALPNVTALYTHGLLTNYVATFRTWPNLKELHVHGNRNITIDVSHLHGHALEALVSSGVRYSTRHSHIVGALMHTGLRDLRTPVAESRIHSLPMLEHVDVPMVNVSDRKSTRLNASHVKRSRIPASA